MPYWLCNVDLDFVGLDLKLKYRLQSRLPSEMSPMGMNHFRFLFGHRPCRKGNLRQVAAFGLRRQGLLFLPCPYLANPKLRCSFGRMV